MKQSLKAGYTALLAAVIFCGCAGTNSISQTNGNGAVTYQSFYDNLSPYGTWIDYPNYGHVWNPRVEGDFRPYATNGHWASSAEGWAWASGYNWGWAPFHYGRWIYDDMYGWLWIPGYDWSPAWVTWGYVDNYYTWAPLMPGLDLSMQFGAWRPHSFYWNACSREHIYDRNLSSAIENPQHIAAVTNRITIINNFNTTRTHNLYYSKGPDVHEVEKYVNHRIEPASIKEVTKINRVSHEGNTMNVYRPAVQDPKQTAQQHPQKMLQPKQFRSAAMAPSNPINREEQKPVVQRSVQQSNIERLPVHYSGERSAGYGGSGGQRHRRN